MLPVPIVKYPLPKRNENVAAGMLQRDRAAAATDDVFPASLATLVQSAPLPSSPLQLPVER